MLAKIGTHTERFSLFDTVELKHQKEWIEAIITALSGHLVHVQFAAKDMCFQRQLRIDSHLMAKAGTHLEHLRRRDWSTPNENANILPPAYDVDDPKICIRSEEQNLPPPAYEDDMESLKTLEDLIDHSGYPKVNGYLDAQDFNGKWFPARVVKVENERIFIHFMNFDSKWDCWMNMKEDQEMLAPFCSNSRMPRTNIYDIGMKVTVNAVLLTEDGNKARGSSSNQQR